MEKKKLGNISTKECIFYGFYFIMLLIECWPGLFMGNSATPFILGAPFFIAYQMICVIITCIVFVVQYFLDNKDGDLDFEIDPNHDYLQDADSI